jgi:DNA modification methylase
MEGFMKFEKLNYGELKATLCNDDCLKVMDKLIEQGVVVDAIICDPPYGMSLTPQRQKSKFANSKIINDDNLLWCDDNLQVELSHYRQY